MDLSPEDVLGQLNTHDSASPPDAVSATSRTAEPVVQRNNSQEEVYIGNAETLEVSAGPVMQIGNATVTVSERNLPNSEPEVTQEASNEPISPSNFDSLSHRLDL